MCKEFVLIYGMAQKLQLCRLKYAACNLPTSPLPVHVVQISLPDWGLTMIA